MEEWVETMQEATDATWMQPGMDYARGGKDTQDEKPNEVTLLGDARARQPGHFGTGFGTDATLPARIDRVTHRPRGFVG